MPVLDAVVIRFQCDGKLEGEELQIALQSALRLWPDVNSLMPPSLPPSLLEQSPLSSAAAGGSSSQQLAKAKARRGRPVSLVRRAEEVRRQQLRAVLLMQFLMLRYKAEVAAVQGRGRASPSPAGAGGGGGGSSLSFAAVLEEGQAALQRCLHELFAAGDPVPRFFKAPKKKRKVQGTAGIRRKGAAGAVVGAVRRQPKEAGVVT